MKQRLLVVLSMLLLLPTSARAQVAPEVLAAEQERVASVAKAIPAVLCIFAAGGQGGGSGVVISADGYALTNFHVARPAGNAMKCGMADGKIYDAVIVGLDPTGDVALVKVLGRDDFPHAELADSDTVRAGDWCFAAGNPFLLATDLQPTISYGVVSGVHRYQYPSGTLLEYADCIQTDAAINPGNSGGPLFNAQGQLIGINGRGSFEKRGRVNVGVGYAISLNQIKNFLGYLKSGRVVDHATLGARVSTSDDGRVVVTDILETSDAYRRGLRYDDEIVSFAGRQIRSTNAFKNALGIFPKGWRVPLSYRREGKQYGVLVRLAGVHRAAELLAKMEAAEEPVPDPAPKPKQEKPLPGTPPEGKPPGDGPQPDGNGPSKDPEKMIPGKIEPKKDGPQPRGGKIRGAHPTHEQVMPDIVKPLFEARAGFANYHFNLSNQDRIRKALLAHGDFAGVAGRWTIAGQAADHSAMSLALTDAEVQISLPIGDSKLTVTDDLSGNLNPPGTGGLLAALHLWRKLLIEGPGKFGQFVYIGTAPVPNHDGLADVLDVTYGQVDCHYFIDPAEGFLLGLEMYPNDELDPCEVYFSDYHEQDGRMLPAVMTVRYGDNPAMTFSLNKLELEPAGAK